VIRDDALQANQQSSWQLLIQFVLPGGSAPERQSVQRVTETVGRLGLQLAELDRIEKAVMEALRQRTQWERRDQHHTILSVRVWVSDGTGGDSARPGSDTRSVGPGKRRGWGFFLVERQADAPETCAKESHHLIELYLYQEKGRATGDPQSPTVFPSRRDGDRGPSGTCSRAIGRAKGKEKQ
jgi:hypothetical protein